MNSIIEGQITYNQSRLEYLTYKESICSRMGIATCNKVLISNNRIKLFKLINFILSSDIPLEDIKVEVRKLYNTSEFNNIEVLSIIEILL